MRKAPERWDRTLQRLGLFTFGLVVGLNEFVVRGYVLSDTHDGGAPRWYVGTMVAVFMGVPIGGVTADLVRAWLSEQEKRDGP